MNNLEIVESFAENFKKEYKKFFYPAYYGCCGNCGVGFRSFKGYG